VGRDEQSQVSGVIFHIMRYSLHDGPGIRTAVFFKGCPLSCWWCHNPESQNSDPDVLYTLDRCRLCGDCLAACPHGAIERATAAITVNQLCQRCGVCVDACAAEARTVAGRRMTAGEVVAEAERDRVFFDESGGGITLTGGEPFSQPELLEAVLLGCRERRIHTAIETCGAAPRDEFLRIAGLADLVMFDLKAMDPERHREYTGAPNRNILENLEALAAERPVIVRIPVVPGVNDGPGEVAAMCEFLSRLKVERVDLLPYHRAGTEKYRRLGREYRMEGTLPPGRPAVEAIEAKLEAVGIRARVAG